MDERMTLLPSKNIDVEAADDSEVEEVTVTWTKRVKCVLGRVLISTCISIVITVIIGVVLTQVKGEYSNGDGKVGPNFDSLANDNNSNNNGTTIDLALELSELRTYKSFDGNELYYRFYESITPSTAVHVVFIHGSGAESRYLALMAKELSQNGSAHVYTPDLRGHGPDSRLVGTRGDIDKENVLERDIAELLKAIKRRHPLSKVVIGGHSSGGGMALRMTSHPEVDGGVFLVSPFLKYNAITTRKNSGGWANVWTTRIIGISILNAFGIQFANHYTTVTFNMPYSVRDGNETLSYSYYMMNGFAPHSNFKNDLRNVCSKCIFEIIVGSKDEAMIAENYQTVLDEVVPDRKFHAQILDGIGHIDIMRSPQMFESFKTFLEPLNNFSS